MCESINQPGGRQPRHPRADHRDALTEEKELKVRMPQRPPGVGDTARLLSDSRHAHSSARRLMISPALNKTSRSCSSSWATAWASHLVFASLALLRRAM